MAKSRTTFQREVDDKLTEEFNNQLPVRKFILTKIAQLTEYLQLRYGGDVRIFIKGGSALNILTEYKTESFGAPKKWSDFDNQIIINPNLPIKAWYQVLFQIHTYLREEYLPVFQKEWDLFLTCNRKELDQKQQGGLDDFSAGLIANTIFDFPRYQFDLAQETDKVKLAYQLHEPLAGDSWQALNLMQENGYQSNMVFSAGMELMHPLNHFDSAMSLLNTEVINDELNLGGIHPDELFYNSYFPPTSSALDDTVTSNESPDSSSILLNTSISKFLLYRIIVRYSNGEFFNDGSIKPLSKQKMFSSSQKVFDGEMRAKFRGELLDVSIPRRDSEETIQQWQQVNTQTAHYFPISEAVGLKATGEKEAKGYIESVLNQGHKGFWLNVPGWDYQLNENILLILEVFKHISGSPHKFWKRVKRATTAVEEIYLSYKAKCDNDFSDFIDTDLNYVKTKEKFTGIADIIEFMRPLIHDVDRVLSSDYDWGVMKPTENDQRILDTLFGENLVTKLDQNWALLSPQSPNGVDTFAEILNRNVSEVDGLRVKCQRMLGFMAIYLNLHDGFKTILCFKGEVVGVNDIKYLNAYRAAIEESVLAPCSFCGLLSSMIDKRVKNSEKNTLDYYYPFVELFLITPAETEVSEDHFANEKVESIEKFTDSPIYDGRQKTYFKIKLRQFDLPVLVWIYPQPEADLVETFNRKLVDLDQIQNRIKALNTDILNYQNKLNSPYTEMLKMDRENLNHQLDEVRGRYEQYVDLQRLCRQEYQMMQIFNPHSTQVIARRASQNFRILKAAEAIKHMDSKIAKSKSFYITHWLDHVRCDYKSSITTF